jgi:putative transposase
MTKASARKPYPSDLSDAEWEQVEPHLPKRKSPRGRKREHSLREIVDAIFYILRSGCSWRMMPHDLPPWKTVYHYFRRWRKEGVWQEINAILRVELRVASGRDPEPSAAIIDSQSVKTTEKGGLVATTPASASAVESDTSSSTRWACS